MFMLAPIEDMTSNAFRTLCYKYGADLTFTELIRIAALARKNKSTWSRLEFNDETPTIIQLLGAKEADFKRFLSMFEPFHGFKGFNLNLGCPSPDVVRIGQGCALVRRIAKTRKLVQIFKDRGFPISIKMRLGLNKLDKERKVYLNLIDAVDADFFAVHARYGAQTYSEPADFSVYEECVKTGKRIAANGDITKAEQIEKLKEIGISDFMIGREAVSYPAIFNRLKGKECPGVDKLKEEYLILADKYIEPFRYRKNVLNHLGKSTMTTEKG